MSVKDIPAELMERIRLQFENDAKVRALRVRQGMEQRRGDFLGAMRTGQLIDHLFNEVVFHYMEEAESEAERVEIDSIAMPKEDKESILVLFLTVFMATDIIDTAVRDVDDILHRQDENFHLEMFNDIRQLSEMAKGKLDYLRKHSGYMKDLVWADKCDDMYEMCRSKARSIMRKRRDDPKWGDNYKKIMSDG